jgi:hypothetical protein
MRKAYLLLLILLLVGCGGQDDGSSAASTVAPTTSQSTETDTTGTDTTETDPTTTEPAPTSATTASELPEGMVGTWSSSEGDATLVFRFSADGTYRHAGVLTQPRATGTFEFSISEIGRATVRGSQLTLRPRSGTTKRKDPDDPSGDYERPISTEPRQLSWRLDSSGDVLYLRDAEGVEVSYDRE